MKREFAFDDALRMLEVMWSSLPPSTPLDDLPLYEVRLCPDSPFPPPPSPLPHETPYTKVCALRRKTSSWKGLTVNRSLDESVIAKRRLRNIVQNNPKKFSSLDDNTVFVDRLSDPKSLKTNSEQVTESCTSISNSGSSDSDSCKSFSNCANSQQSESHKSFQYSEESDLRRNYGSAKIVKNLNEFLTLEKKISKKKKLRNDNEKDNNHSDFSSSSSNSSPDDSSEYYPMTTSMTQKLTRDLEDLEKRVFEIHIEENTAKNAVEEVFVWENPLQYESVDDATNDGSNSQVPVGTPINGNTTHETLEYNMIRGKEKVLLPGPNEFGCGNPFLMFLCIAVLCQHRDAVMKSGMDYNEIAMHFDKMVRKHNVTRVLNQARLLYATYLKQHKQNFLRV